MQQAPIYFEGYRLDPRARVLSAPDGEPVALTAKAFDVLVYLVEHADRVVRKDELLDHVWRGRVVEENNLNQAISALRRALGASGGDHRFVVTVPGQGYRFVANLRREDAGTFQAGRRPRRRTLGLAALLLAGVVVLAVISRQQSPGLQALAPTLPTLAVLPFHPVSDDPGDDLLALGLAETLITRLSRAEGLRVRALGSASRLANFNLNPLQTAQELGALYVVDGSTQRSGSELRVNVRLMRAVGGDVIWGETYDTDLEQVFAVQDRIAREIAQALSVSANGLAAAHTSPCEGDDAEAYRAYLSGLRQVQSPSPASLRSAIRAFERTVQMDPACARAWAGLAFVWRAMSITGDMHSKEAFPRAIDAVNQALELNPDLAEAHASLGFIRFWHHWDWAAAEASFRRAIDLNPSLAEARLGYAHLLSNLGRHTEALDQIRQARELDPFWPMVNTLEASFLHAAGRHREAREQSDLALELAPDFWIAHVIRGTIALDTGDPEAAVTYLERADQLSGGATQALGLLGIAYAQAGQVDRAAALLSQLKIQTRESYVPATILASMHNALGDEETALDLLEQAWNERDLRLTFLKVDRRWDNLRANPRFVDLVARLGLG